MYVTPAQGCRVDGEWLDAALASFKRQMHEAKAHDLVTMLDTVGHRGRATAGRKFVAHG